MLFLYELDKNVQRQWIRFQHDRSREAFSALREAVAQSPEFDPSSTELNTIVQMLEQGNVNESKDLFKTVVPNWLMTPHVHRMAAFIYSKGCQRSNAEREIFLSNLLQQGILASGNGTEAHPYLILHPEDTKDVLAHFKKSVTEETTVEQDGKQLVCVQCADGARLWFDRTLPTVESVETLSIEETVESDELVAV
jgi:hypothetical protein